ncbi:MAG: L-threonylcarbamoyladenylate synthase [Microthrixaceae bacterium]|nr:threonylcarbamoyl-AMP synthase [Microthrixaceae bacterium]MCO5313474.1 L-threonylcarbamoyladenylate synthase [Microthrixaceae bacterium]
MEEPQIDPVAPVVAVVGADQHGLECAAEALRSGSCVGLPTDTVYGLSAALSRSGAVRSLFELKGRAATKAMAVLVGSVDQARELGVLNEHAVEIVQRYWPGPLTVVVRRADGLRIDLGGDSGTIGLRCPDSALLNALIAQVGPLVTTSANRAGHPTITSAARIAEEFGDRLAVVIDGGELAESASTVVDLSGTGIDVLREGPIPTGDLMRASRR